PADWKAEIAGCSRHTRSAVISLLWAQEIAIAQTDPALRQHKIGYGREVAGGRQQHEHVPDRVLKPQSLPKVEGDTGRIEESGSDDEANCECRQAGKQRVIENHPAPAHQ